MANIPKGEIKWTASAGSTTGYTQKPTAKYSAISDGLRQITPETWKCSMFCGGKNCKYCNVPRGNWPTERMAIDGLFSEWVTDDILATSRPSTNAVKNIIEEFKKCGINSIINLQRPGEHASCGSPLEEESGFSYLPKDFMDENIFFYNFGWDDYGIRSLPSILDMVKVMSFALQEGKTAVHCHAGLGRTGVLIACYLIFSKRMDADQAIHFVREKRPGAIQTRGQIECCQQFGQFLIPLRVVFYSIDTRAYPFTLNQYLIRQKHMLHGYEARELKNIPKIIHVVCKRLTQLANCDFGIMNELNLSYERKMQIEKETAGKAFPEVRKKIPFEQSVSEGNTKVGVLPPIRRAKSEENILAECNEVNGQSSGTLNVPKATLSPGSPNLRFRSPNSDLDMKGTSGSSSSDDDLVMTRSDIYPLKSLPRNLQSQASRDSIMSTAMSIDAGVISGKNKRPIRSRLSRGPFPRRSSILSQLSESMDVEEDNQDVFIVAKAMAFVIDAKADLHEKARVDAFQALKQRLESLQNDLNVSNASWNILSTEEDPYVLCTLMYSWLEHLKEPMLSVQCIHNLIDHVDDPRSGLKLLERHERQTLECIMKTVAKLQPLSKELELPILNRILAAVSGQAVTDKNNSFIQFLHSYLKDLCQRISDNTLSETASIDSQSIGGGGDENNQRKAVIAHAATYTALPLKATPQSDFAMNKSHSEPSMPIPSKKNNTLPPIK